MADRLEIDVESLRDLGFDLVRAGEEIALEVPEQLAVIAKALEAKAKSAAGSYVGTGRYATGAKDAVVSSIRAIPTSSHEWRVQAGGASIPLAGLWELGNKGSGEDDATFRHPVFGRGSGWENQRKWPFLRMAVRAYGPEAVQRMVGLLDDILARHRL